MYNAACRLPCSWIWVLSRFSILYFHLIELLSNKTFALSTYNPLHHSICIHSSLISFSVYNSCGLLTQRPALGQIRILFVFSVGSSRPTVSFLSQQCPILLFTPASTALCSFDYHSHSCDLRKYRCLINTNLAAHLTQSPNRAHNH